MRINQEFSKLNSSYLFSKIAAKVREYEKENNKHQIIRLGIGDVTRPLVPAVIDAMQKAVAEMGNKNTFRGYPPEYGYDFLLEEIVKNDFHARGIEIEKNEIFVTDGAKSDTGNIGDIFSRDNIVALCDPIYPVYADTNVMSGRKDNIVFLRCIEESNFTPDLPQKKVDLIYICSPNNPTGTVMSRESLKAFVDYANENDSVLLFDAAYEAFIQDKSIPHSIYEIDGAENCAIEFRSFSKTAGFTGVRCGYTVLPKKLIRDGNSLNALWARRQATKFNGVSYITQRGAEAVYSEKGKLQIKENIDYYLGNAQIIERALSEYGLKVWGAKNSPYVWFKIPQGYTSWKFFDKLLLEIGVVGTPGEGFGECGEGFFRLTGFGEREKIIEAVDRIKGIKF